MAAWAIGDLLNAWNRKYPGKDVSFSLRRLVYFAGKPKTRCSECTSESFLPVDDHVILAHLNGNTPLGASS